MARRRREDSDHESDLHSQIFQLLLEKVQADTYPSTTMLDMLESLARDEDELDEFTSTLMEKVGDDSYPSMDYLRRIQKLA